MQIYICIYRYICMELYQQQECCSLRLWLCPTPLSSSQRTWQQFHLVTSRPGQTGLSCLCFSRPRGASSVCHTWLWASLDKQRHRTGKDSVHTGRPRASRHARLLRLLHHSPERASYWVPRSWHFVFTFLCNQTTLCATEQLLNASQGSTTAEHHTQSPRSPQRRQRVTLLRENILVPSVKMVVFRAGWAFVCNL